MSVAPARPSGASLAPAVFVLPAVAAVQLIPLPPALLLLLSPQRARDAAAAADLAGGAQWAPLSSAPEATLQFLVLAAALCVVFVVIGAAASRFRDPWMLAAPIVLVALGEAALGLAFVAPGGNAAGISGTYANRNHYAAFLAAAFPFAAVYALSQRSRAPLAAGAAGACALVLAAAVLHSLSRAGLAALALAAAWIAVTQSRGRQIAVPAGLAAALALSAFALAPSQLVGRLGENALSGRLQFWTEAAALAAAYPVTGCGLGAFESAIHPWRAAAPALALDYAHNDVLQLAAEAGLGAVVLLGFAALRTARLLRRTAKSWLGTACGASLLALLVFALVDSHLRVPVNSLTAAWIVGLLSGLDRRHRGYAQGL